MLVTIRSPSQARKIEGKMTITAGGYVGGPVILQTHQFHSNKWTTIRIDNDEAVALRDFLNNLYPVK